MSFTVLAYAGELVCTVSADRDAVPDLDQLRVELQAELNRLGPACSIG